jgi:hypothetical protein
LCEPKAAKSQRRIIDQIPSASPELEEAKRQVINKRKEFAGMFLDSFVAALTSLEALERKNFLIPGHTEKTVKESLTKTLRVFYEPGLEFTFGPDAQGNQYRVVVKSDGVAWELQVIDNIGVPAKDIEAMSGKKPRSKKGSFKGTITWKAVSDKICSNWWNLTIYPPQMK